MIQWSKRKENILNATDDPLPFNDGGIFEDDYLQKIWNGIINKRHLDRDYHSKVGSFLYEGASKGYGAHVDSFSDVTKLGQTIEGIRDNVYIFSAAKQYQQVRQMSEFINADGVKTTFTEFKKFATVVFKEFNVDYLKTEYNTAVGQSQMARDWVEFEMHKDIFPLLQYKTQGDGRVRDAHAILANVIKKVDDPFWNYYMPKNGWNCRCFVISLMEGKESRRKDFPAWGTNEFPEVFKMNPGKDQMIYKPDHPYFEVAKGDKGFKKDNFGLPIP